MSDPWHPDEAELLALQRDEATGVEYIPTGLSPYHLAFRRMLWMILRSLERANDFRVQRDGELSVAVAAGRTRIGTNEITFEAQQDVDVQPEGETCLWIDADGELQSDGEGFPEDWSTFLPLAKVEASEGKIQSIEDRRGQALWRVPSLASLGLSTSIEQIDQALDGIDPAVTAFALNLLCAGSTSNADLFHRHEMFTHDVPAPAWLSLSNDNDDAAAEIRLRLGLAQHHSEWAELTLTPDSHWLQQRYGPDTRAIVGSTQAHDTLPGPFTQSLTARIVAPASLKGRISDVVLSAGTNIESNENDDGVSLMVHVNGQAALDTPAQLRADDGPGFRSTAQNDGAPAQIKGGSEPDVQRGDILSIDLTRDVSGSVAEEMADLAVLIIMRADEAG